MCSKGLSRICHFLPTDPKSNPQNMQQIISRKTDIESNQQLTELLLSTSEIFQPKGTTFRAGQPKEARSLSPRAPFFCCAGLNAGGSRMRIPNLGWVRMRETLRFTGKIMSVTVSRVAERWLQ
jgi:hypothetical protein